MSLGRSVFTAELSELHELRDQLQRKNEQKLQTRGWLAWRAESSETDTLSDNSCGSHHAALGASQVGVTARGALKSSKRCSLIYTDRLTQSPIYRDSAPVAEVSVDVWGGQQAVVLHPRRWWPLAEPQCKDERDRKTQRARAPRPNEGFGDFIEHYEPKF